VPAYRFALRPGWFALHVLAVALAVTMVLLGRWQLHVSESKGFDIQNFGYSIQWWLFAACTLALWGRILRDQARRERPAGGPADAVTEPAPAPTAAEPVTYRRYVMPTTSTERDDDPVHSAYNDYLAWLNEESQ
jgi:hypothetical protein